MFGTLFKAREWILAVALVVNSSPNTPLQAAAFADAVESYDPATGFAVEFGSGLGYTLESAVLGPLNTETSFGAVEPFNPPFERSELLSLGTGGHLIVRFDMPILNHASAWFGLDFIIYGSAGFIDTDYPQGVTDGQASLFGQNTGQTRVSVSQDNQVYFVLDPARAPVVDGLYPTDGSGLFGLPIDPLLGPADFAGKSRAEIRALYNGSAGGTAYDLDWALDSGGQPALLDQVRYVRIDVLSGRSEIDAIAAVPEPATWLIALLFALACLVLPVRGATVREDFSTDPAGNGWQSVGDATLFSWDQTGQRMQVTWDSARTNSYFWLPLGTVLTKEEDFRASFDLVLSNVISGHRPNKPYTFEVALGFLNRATATGADFRRGEASTVKNVVEFDYFPPFLTFGATVAFTMVSSNSLFEYSHNFPLELSLEDRFHVLMDFRAADRILEVGMTRNGAPFGPLENIGVSPGFSDFRLDAFAMCSYSDAGADGSILAQGWVDNIELSVPAPPVGQVRGRWTNQLWQVEFESRNSWRYTLERTLDFLRWEEASGAVNGSGEVLILTDSAPAGSGFYRIKAERP